MVSAVIVAGGKGKRMGAAINKVYLKLLGKEIIAHTIAAFDGCDIIDEIIVVTGTDDIETCREIVRREGFRKVKKIIEGGAERSDSVYNGISAAHGDIAAIHDGARCLITDSEIKAVISDAAVFGAAALGVTVKDTLKSIDKNGNITGTVDRDATVYIQTPQVFNRNEILRLHKKIADDHITVTDDCSVYEHYGKTVHVTIGSYDNIKLTTPEDIAIGEDILKRRRKQI